MKGNIIFFHVTETFRESIRERFWILHSGDLVMLIFSDHKIAGGL